jgi:hypothetical protein
MATRQPVDPELLKAARQGLLTRRNTGKGTAERRAVDRWTYLERRKAHPELSARQAAGHEAPGDTGPWGTFFGQTAAGVAVFFMVRLSRRDERRAGRYMALVGQLAAGRLSGNAFRAKVNSWRPITVVYPDGNREVRFVSDPAAALVLANEVRGEGPPRLFDSGRKRPAPRRRR